VEVEKNIKNARKTLNMMTAEEQFLLIKDRSHSITQPEELLERLVKSKKTHTPLKVKYGIDPTSTDVHLGHMVPLVIGRRFIAMGHEFFVVVGDFTAMVGDPTGIVETRPLLSNSEITRNQKVIMDRLKRYLKSGLSPKKNCEEPGGTLRITNNSKFYTNMSIKDLFEIYRLNKAAPLMQREGFRNRIEGLTIAELLYATLMAIDSINIRPDIELGGKDQFLNFQIAREFMKNSGLQAECAITTDLLQGTSGDGEKMSKSKDNYISLLESKDEIYGKVMSIPDTLIEHYFKLLTDISNSDYNKISEAMKKDNLNPMHVKQLLARVILVDLGFEPSQVELTEKSFEEVFSKGKVPSNIPEVTLPNIESKHPWISLLTIIGAANSNSQARTFITDGSVKTLCDNGSWKKVEEINESLPDHEFTLKVGKRMFFKIKK